MNYDYDYVLVSNKRWNEHIKSASALVETYSTVHVHLLYSTSAFINRYFALRQEGSEAALKRSNPFEWI